MEYKFYMDGVSSLDCGIQMQGPITFGNASARVTSFSVPGRNGDLHIWDGSFNNVSASAKCYALDENGADRKLQAASLFLSGDNMGYRKLETEDEPDIYRMARVVNLPETEIRMRILAPFTISFDCDPRKFLKSGEIEQEVTSATTLFNMWGTALPLIHIYGTGEGKFQIGAYVVYISEIDGDLYLDCDLQDAYKISGDVQTSANSLVSWTKCPRLEHGENEISFIGGITKMSILPRWCYV